MNEVNLPAIEPVTDEDTRVAMQSYFINMKHILIHDRRRVAERQAERHSVGSTLRHTNVARLRELSHAVTQGPDAIRRECSMRVPAEPDRDADLVLSSAADEIERLRAEVAKMHARRAVLFGELIELKRAIENGHRASAIAIIDAIARVIPDQSKTLAELRAEVAAHRKHDVLRCDALMKAEAEVAKLRAACAAMQERCARACEDEARIWEADGKGPECAARLCAARIRSLPNVTDAGKGWIDASGAVEARLHCEYGDPSVGVGDHWFLTDNDMDYTWAGSKVKIVRVKP